MKRYDVLDGRWYSYEEECEDGMYCKWEDVKEVLESIHPFIIHALCSIPDDQESYKEASRIIKHLNKTLYGELSKKLEQKNV